MALSPLRLDNIVVAQQNSTAQLIGWRFFAVGVSGENARVAIYRSYVENDGFELIDRIAASRGWYRDDTVVLTDRYQLPFYKLVVEDLNGNTREYGPIRVKGETTVIARSLTQNTNLYLGLAGVPVLIYQKKFDLSERCTVCWDIDLQKSTLSNCPECLGTGFVGGFYTPILTLAALGVEVKANMLGSRTTQDTQIEGSMSNYPVLRPADILYVVDRGHRYRIEQVTPVEMHQSLIKQDFLLAGLKPTDVEDSIPIPDLNTLDPILSRVDAPHRLTSRSDDVPNNTTFDRTRI